MTATVTLPGIYVDYLRGTEVWTEDNPNLADRELGDALRSAPRRKTGRGWNVTVTLTRPALYAARDHAIDLAEPIGIVYEPSWQQAGRTALARIDAALTATN